MNWQEYQDQYNQQTYRCPRCLDTGIIAWMSKTDMLWYGRKCNCDYFDRQREEYRSRRGGDY